jgi:maltooligosyltrehalose trehalohydrolase
MAEPAPSADAGASGRQRGEGARRFEVWAPTAPCVELALRDDLLPMLPVGDRGWWQVDAPAAVGDRYGFALDGGEPLKDPRAVWLPDGVLALGAVYDHDGFAWSDGGWVGRPLAGAVIYELHVGTFTLAGTFDGVIERLDALQDLGVTHLEVMPVCSWDGPRGWGYDGVALWSVHEAYGGPDGLKRLVDAAHRVGLAVLLDVIHNHLGPSGNTLTPFGPYTSDERYRTPWGPAINLDSARSDEVRTFLRGSVTQWLRDFHLDGLRLDAVHELYDVRAQPWLEELAGHVTDLEAELGRTLLLIAESDRNDPATVLPVEAGGLGMDGQWSDDAHHALHVVVTGEDQGYYADFGADPDATMRKVWAEGFFHDGCWSSFRQRSHGARLPDAVPAWRLVTCLQNHDQVGNRPVGDRLAATLAADRIAAGMALLLTAPFTPMLFMGEEWGTRRPWPFFSSVTDPELGRAISEGRRAELAALGHDLDDVLDPQNPATFRAATLDWGELALDEHRRLRDWTRDLVRLRAAVPDLGPGRLRTADAGVVDGVVTVRRGRHVVLANLCADARAVPVLDGGVTLLASWGAVEVLDASLHLGAGATVVAQLGP